MKARQGFAGFPEGPQRLTPIPGLFFSDLLPAIDDLAELKVTLYAFWALSLQDGPYRAVSLRQIADDTAFMQGLEAVRVAPDEALAEALERAVSRGTLIRATIEQGETSDTYFLLNSAKGRAALAALESGEWSPGGPAPTVTIERPNIFNLYEQNIGPLTPLIAETLRDAEQSYPSSWIEEALRIAVENNVRKWRYVEAILESWRTRGRDEREDRGDSEKARRRYVEGEFADFIEH